MSARERQARWLRLDPDRRVEAMAATVEDLTSRRDRLRVALADAGQTARMLAADLEQARTEAQEAKAEAEACGRRLWYVEAQVQRAMAVLGNTDLSYPDANERARQVLAAVPVSGGGDSG